VSEIFDKIGCDATPIKTTLGGEGGITFNNVTIYMARIEARAMELLKGMYYLNMRVSEADRLLSNTATLTVSELITIWCFV